MLLLVPQVELIIAQSNTEHPRLDLEPVQMQVHMLKGSIETGLGLVRL